MPMNNINTNTENTKNNKLISQIPRAHSVTATLTSTLPIDGWIKTCIKCGQPTSRSFVVYKYKYDRIYNCYYCKDCVKDKHDINDDMIKKITNKEIQIYEKRLSLSKTKNDL